MTNKIDMKTIKLSRNSKKIEIPIISKTVEPSNSNISPQYAGFHLRMLSTLIDLFLVGLLFAPVFSIITSLIHGSILPVDVINNAAQEFETLYKNNHNTDALLFFKTDPAIKEYFITNHGLAKVFINQAIQFSILLSLFLYFWIKKQATPGKMLLSLKIVDANTLSKPSNRQLIVRLFSCIISVLCLFLGMLWIAFNTKKQGWHDKIANTLVIKEKKQKKK
jgi:uncharacterized RDD family membrane protein YckC